MGSYDQRLHDLFDGDPNAFEEYHQDYREGTHSPFARIGPGLITILLFFSVPVIYQILFALDYDLLPIPELLWNVLVYFTPSRLLKAVEDYQSPLGIRVPALKGIPKTHAAKSESMRRILGLNTPGGIIGSVAQAGRRRLSTISGINVAVGADSRPAGLGNWDNSCYQNSVLQGLASLNSLSGYLTNPNIEELEDEDKLDMKMAEALRGLIETLNDPSNNGRKIWTPATLKNMSSWQQQDAQEYFSKILDEIDKEVAKVAKTMRSSQGFESDDSPSSSSSQISTITTPSMSHFRNPLEGLIAQRVGCTRCGYSEGLSMIPFNCLTVPLGRGWEYDISECLDEYTRLEPIDGVECGKCTLLKSQRLLQTILERTNDTPDSIVHIQSKERLAKVTEALEDDDYEENTLAQECKISPKSRVSSTKSRQAVIARPPRSLVIHVNRSLFDEMTGELKKNSSSVRFPKTFDLGPWCLGSVGTTQENAIEEWLLNPDRPMIASSANPSRLRGPLYELRAVVTHYGRHENGHYICYKKHPSVEAESRVMRDQWWRLSDDDVTKVSEEDVLDQGGVFMLFYDLVEAAVPMFSEITSAPAPHAMSNDIVASSSRKLQDLEALESSLRVPLPPDSEELAAAVNVPLPSMDDSDLSDFDDEESHMDREESIATTVSECDDEDTADEKQPTYAPVKPIVVPQYIPQTGGRNDGEGTVSSPGSLVMV